MIKVRDEQARQTSVLKDYESDCQILNQLKALKRVLLKLIV